jgi:hypothetical protein
LAQNKATLFIIFIIPLDFKKNANFFAENLQKSQKLVIITSTPGLETITFDALAPTEQKIPGSNPSRV